MKNLHPEKNLKRSMFSVFCTLNFKVQNTDIIKLKCINIDNAFFH